MKSLTTLVVAVVGPLLFGGLVSAQDQNAVNLPTSCVHCPIQTTQQLAPSRKDIPTIAKAAKGAIVTIVMASNDEPIARGTGFLVRADGAIVTNYHVIAKGNFGVVKFADGTILRVDGVLATDKFRDLAIIKIHGKTFPTLTLGNSDQIQVGEDIVAIGNPLGLELTVSNGILSGIRSDEKEDRKLLQITAPISHGSSGGPLFNMSGEVVGISAMFLEGGESLNFAIPVNDAKNLIQNQTVQLQQLPDERDAGKPEPDLPKPDASTGLPSDAVSPREKAIGIFPPPYKPAKGKQAPSYYVRAYHHGSYIIEYDGHQLAATCRESLVWLSGIDKPGSSRAEHDCTFMHSLVGYRISPELMWRGDKELRYRPGAGQDLSPQVADVLDITAEAPTGSPLRGGLPKASPKASPEILKTLHWIQNTLADMDGETHYVNNKDNKDDTRLHLLLDVNGCQVTFAYGTQSDGDETHHDRQQVNLGDLDPTSLEVNGFSQDYLGPVSLVTVHTTDKVPAVRLMNNDRNWQPAMGETPSTDLTWVLPAPYAARFAKALHQAITLCGGKASIF